MKGGPIEQEPRYETIQAEVQAVEAISWGPGRIDLFGHSYHGSITHTSWDEEHDAWTAWEDLAGTFLHVCKAVTHAPGGLNIFAVGKDSGLWRKRRDRHTGKWGAWIHIGGEVIDRPGLLNGEIHSQVKLFTRQSNPLCSAGQMNEDILLEYSLPCVTHATYCAL